MSLAPDGRLLISTIGTVNAPSVVAQDEDVIVFTGALGENASGVWSLYFDGSAAGLTTGSEDVTGIWVDGATQIPVTTDIFVCHPTTPGNAATCIFSRFFDGNAVGLHEPLDGIFIQRSQQAITAAAFTSGEEPDEVPFEMQEKGATPEDALDAEIDEYDQAEVETTEEAGAMRLFLPLIAR